MQIFLKYLSNIALKYCSVLFNIVQVNIYVNSCMSCNVVGILSNIFQYCLILSCIDQYCSLASYVEIFPLQLKLRRFKLYLEAVKTSELVESMRKSSLTSNYWDKSWTHCGYFCYENNFVRKLICAYNKKIKISYCCWKCFQVALLHLIFAICHLLPIICNHMSCFQM